MVWAQALGTSKIPSSLCTIRDLCLALRLEEAVLHRRLKLAGRRREEDMIDFRFALGAAGMGEMLVVVEIDD